MGAVSWEMQTAMGRGEREEKQRKPQPFGCAGKGTWVFYSHHPPQQKCMTCDQPRDMCSPKGALYLLLRELPLGGGAAFAGQHLAC